MREYIKIFFYLITAKAIFTVLLKTNIFFFVNFHVVVCLFLFLIIILIKKNVNKHNFYFFVLFIFIIILIFWGLYLLNDQLFIFTFFEEIVFKINSSNFVKDIQNIYKNIKKIFFED